MPSYMKHETVYAVSWDNSVWEFEVVEDLGTSITVIPLDGVDHICKSHLLPSLGYANDVAKAFSIVDMLKAGPIDELLEEDDDELDDLENGCP